MVFGRDLDKVIRCLGNELDVKYYAWNYETLAYDIRKNKLITCYTSPTNVNRYKNSNGRVDMAYEQTMNDNLRKNLMALMK